MLNISCGGGIYLGNNETCAANESTKQFDHVIHIIRSPSDSRSCPVGRKGNALVVTWTEGEPIERVADSIIAYAKETLPGTLLVHCEGGIYRSPHAVLLAAIGRGVDPLTPFTILTRERYRLVAQCPEWQRLYLNYVMSRRA